jgi:hypothetical protein
MLCFSAGLRHFETICGEKETVVIVVSDRVQRFGILEIRGGSRVVDSLFWISTSVKAG